MLAGRIACLNCCGPKDDGESISITASQDVSRYPAAAAMSAAAAADVADVSETAKPPKVAALPRMHVSRRAGKPCTSRMPVAGDHVVSTGGKRTGHNAAGVAKAWVLMPWHVAQVLQVDADGDFRLLNEQGVESGFMFRKEFAYVAEEDASDRAGSPSRSPAARSTSPARGGEPSVSLMRDSRFQVKLEGSEGKLGLVLDKSTAAFEILAVDGGRALAHNQKAEAAQRLCFGDFVVGVNGVSADAVAMEKELTKPQLTLTVAPRVKFTALVECKGGQDIGMSCSFKEGESATLLVDKVNWTGAVPSYNSKAKGALVIVQGDRITEVNGLRNRPKEMHELLARGGALELVVGRPLA